ncbi:MAG: hypothetical protein AAF772_17400, partial [Acidobacteriota bacterium]
MTGWIQNALRHLERRAWRVLLHVVRAALAPTRTLLSGRRAAEIDALERLIARLEQMAAQPSLPSSAPPPEDADAAADRRGALLPGEASAAPGGSVAGAPPPDSAAVAPSPDAPAPTRDRVRMEAPAPSPTGDHSAPLPPPPFDGEGTGAFVPPQQPAQTAVLVALAAEEGIKRGTAQVTVDDDGALAHLRAALGQFNLSDCK